MAHHMSISLLHLSHWHEYIEIQIIYHIECHIIQKKIEYQN